MRFIAFCVALWLAVFTLTYGLLAPNDPHYTDAQKLAVRIDAILDDMAPPNEFWPESLDPYWTFEITPYFGYEGLTKLTPEPVSVVFEPQLDSMSHNHILGYTFCEDVVYINIRVINPMSAWYGWERNPLATLVHEMVHTLGGSFCSIDSPKAESSTQTGTLEVLAALANGGNRMALYALLQELKDMAMDVVLAQALHDNDLDGYRDFRAVVDPSARDEARFEKSMRFWAKDMGFLREILEKYSVLVYQNVDRGSLSVDIEGDYSGAEVKVPLDDLLYVLDHAEDMAGEAPPE